MRHYLAEATILSFINQQVEWDVQKQFKARYQIPPNWLCFLFFSLEIKITDTAKTYLLPPLPPHKLVFSVRPRQHHV